MEEYKLIELERAFQSPLKKQFYRAFHKPLESTMSIQAINAVYNDVALRCRKDVEGEKNFFDHALDSMGVSYRISAKELARIPSEGPVICVANHPYGGIDGIILGSLMASARPDSKLLVNYLLNRIIELREWTFEVNPFGTSKAARMNSTPLKAILRWLKAGHCLGTFPAGMVSHLHPSTRMITDRSWTPHTATLIQRTKATVVPIFFEGHNNAFFQVAGLLHPRMRTALLARQFVNKRGQTIDVKIGRPLTPNNLSRFTDPEALTEFLRMNTYVLGKRNDESTKPKSKKGSSLKTAQHQPIEERKPVESLIEDIQKLPEEACLVSKGIFSVYYAKIEQIPNIIHEIGRSREQTFRAVDEGSGKSLDIDKYDSIYHHLFMWDNESCEIVGAYRFCFVDQVLAEHGVEGLYCNTLYEFKEGLLDKLNPSLEMGRSFIATKYQKRKTTLALLWRGIGELVGRFPKYHTLFGAVSMTDTYHPLSKMLMVEYLKHNKLHPTLGKLMKAKVKPKLKGTRSLRSIAFNSSLPELNDVSSLVSEVEQDNKGVPTLLKHYLQLNGVILCFGIDEGFSDALDGFVVVDMLQSDRRLLRKYLGDSAFQQLMDYHGQTVPEEV